MHRLPEKPPSIWDKEIGLNQTKFANDLTLQKEIADFNRRYLYWDELKYRIKDAERRSFVWSFMKILRLMRYEKIPFKNLDVLYSFIPEIVKGLHSIDRYLSGTIEIHNKTIKLEQSYIINSLMEEAIASSILEGADTTRKVAKNMLMRGAKPKNQAEQMVLNNYEAMQFIVDRKNVPLSKELILNLHRIVAKNTMDESYVGRFRTDNEVEVVDSSTGLLYHTPPDFKIIEGFIEELCKFANADAAIDGKEPDEFIHPIIKGVILHYFIGYLHPFNDGNGRTARSIFYWYVLSRGYWLFEFMPISRIILRSKKNYALSYLYSEYDQGDLTYFIKYNVHCITKSLEDLLKYLERKQSEQNATKAIIKKIKDINQRQAAILRYMMEHSDEHFTIKQIMQMHSVVNQTARSDLLYLTERGYLMKEERGKAFYFIFNEKSELWKEKSERKLLKRPQKELGEF
jgi:Fic family protein